MRNFLRVTVKPLFGFMEGGHYLVKYGFCSLFFFSIQARYNCHNNAMPEPSGRSSGADRPLTPEPECIGPKATRSGTKRFRRDDRELDEDEEQWFQSDESEEKDTENVEVNGKESGLLSTSPVGGVNKSLSSVNTAPPVKRPVVVSKKIMNHISETEIFSGFFSITPSN